MSFKDVYGKIGIEQGEKGLDLTAVAKNQDLHQD